MQAKIIRVTFLDKEDKLIGSPYKENVKWIRTEMVSMLEIDKQTGHTILTYGTSPLRVKEAPEVLAKMINGE